MSRGQQAYFHTTEGKVGNASWRPSRAFYARVDALASRGVVHYLPPYCPELNPIETLWRKIKSDWMPLACYASYGCMKNAVMEVLGGFGHNYQISFV